MRPALLDGFNPPRPPNKYSIKDILKKINVTHSGSCSVVTVVQLQAPCGLRGCKNRPAPFPGRMLYKRLNQALSVLSLSIRFSVLLFIRVPFCVLLVYVGIVLPFGCSG